MGTLGCGETAIRKQHPLQQSQRKTGSRWPIAFWIVAAAVAMYAVSFQLGRSMRRESLPLPTMDELPIDQQETLLDKLPMTAEERSAAKARLHGGR